MACDPSGLVYMTVKNAGPISITRADHESEIVVGKSRGCAPVTVARTWAFAAATDIGLGEAEADGDATNEGGGDTDAAWLDEPHAAANAPMRATMASEKLRLSTTPTFGSRGRQCKGRSTWGWKCFRFPRSGNQPRLSCRPQ